VISSVILSFCLSVCLSVCRITANQPISLELGVMIALPIGRTG